MPTIWGDGALSIVERSGLLEDMLEEYRQDPEEGLVAICTMRRRRRPTPITNRFSMAMAERARLTHKEGPWQTYPQRMLRMRARSWTIRDGFADVLRGLHIREEVDDFIEIRGLLPSLANCAAETRRSFWRDQGTARPRRTPPPGPQHPGAAQPAPITDAGVAEGSDRPAAAGAGMGRLEAAGRVPEPPKTTALEAKGPQAEGLPAAPAPPEQSFALVDADGVFIEVCGAAIMRAEFERIFAAKHLFPDQIARLWEANQPARAAIERLFGAEALQPVSARVQSAQPAREQQSTEPRTEQHPAPDPQVRQHERREQHDTQARPVRVSPAGPRRAAARPPLDTAGRACFRKAERTRPPNRAAARRPSPQSAPAHRPARGRHQTEEAPAPSHRMDKPKRPGQHSAPSKPAAPMPPDNANSATTRPATHAADQSCAADAGLVLHIDPSWGDQKVFRHYRTSLAALRNDNGSGDTPPIARFRQANQTLETRLRAKLPQLMQQIDATYGPWHLQPA